MDRRGRRVDLGPTHSSLTPLDQGTVTSGRSALPSNPSDDDADRNLQGRGWVRACILPLEAALGGPRPAHLAVSMFA
jgi:hypothetical protein